MKLLAAVPPLLFLALYFLSFIHLSVSPNLFQWLSSCVGSRSNTSGSQATKPYNNEKHTKSVSPDQQTLDVEEHHVERQNTSGSHTTIGAVAHSIVSPSEEQTHNGREALGTVTNTPDDLPEEKLRKAEEALKNSKETEETLQDMSLILWSLGGIKTVASSTRENAIAVVKATFANNVDYPQTDVSVEKVLFIPYGDIVVTLKCGKEVGEVRYSPHPDQNDERKRAGYEKEISNKRTDLADLYVSSGLPILPYVHALGGTPAVAHVHLAVRSWTFSDQFIVEETPRPMVSIVIAGRYYRLRRYSDVTIKRKKDDKVMCMYVSHREINVDSSTVNTAQGFTENCIWNDLILKRRDDINRIYCSCGLSSEQQGTTQFEELEYKSDGNGYSVTTSYADSERCYVKDLSVVKIGVFTHFPGLGDNANDIFVYHVHQVDEPIP
eukprot:GHVS01023494.1.p1 GENE.GHVS01023494.1~~GHVS01023494.1.p1  ORF type:complete len:438 (-),score=46.48 GHVS01023494.1:74-1387(-)